jgi:hypothetical protein
VLDLGLEEALKRLGERRSAQLTITLDGAAGRLSRDEETTVYRVVEEALDAFDHPGAAVVEANPGELIVRVGGARGEAPRTERVKTIGARLELLRGSLTTNGELRVRIPLS